MAGFFDNLFGGGAEREAAEKNRALYGQYGTLGQGYLDTGLNSSKGAFDSAKADYAPLSALAGKFGQGTDMLLNAYGLNGASGNAAAQSAFTSSPGYDWQVGQGLDAINRRRASGGMLNSGNADLDALNYGQGLAKQDYNGWLSGLTGLSNNALTATAGASSGLAGIDTGLANLYQQDATNRVGLQGNVTSGNASANNLQAQGEAAGARNLLGAGLSVASLAAGGGLGGLGGLGSALGSVGTNMMNNGGMFNPIAGMTGR